MKVKSRRFNLQARRIRQPFIRSVEGSKMINRQVRQFYIDKENVDHSITDRLISGGYVQPAGGYILNAKRSGVKEPSQ